MQDGDKITGTQKLGTTLNIKTIKKKHQFVTSYLIVMIAIDLQIKNWTYIIEHTNHTHHTTELLS